VRFIDLDSLYGDAAAGPLIDAADAAAEQLLEAEPDERSELIKQGRRVWSDFRPVMEAVFGSKCWYTESRNPGTDDDVDHFRPKGRIAEAPDHGGY
jgi:hypothetical protein